VWGAALTAAQLRIVLEPRRRQADHLNRRRCKIHTSTTYRRRIRRRRRRNRGGWNSGGGGGKELAKGDQEVGGKQRRLGGQVGERRLAVGEEGEAVGEEGAGEGAAVGGAGGPLLGHPQPRTVEDGQLAGAEAHAHQAGQRLHFELHIAALGEEGEELEPASRLADLYQNEKKGRVLGLGRRSIDANYLRMASTVSHKQLFLSRYCKSVFRIYDIFVWIRIRGSMPLTNGSGFGSGSCYFVTELQDANKKI
jgi:hypothetical protein